MRCVDRDGDLGLTKQTQADIDQGCVLFIHSNPGRSSEDLKQIVSSCVANGGGVVFYRHMPNAGMTGGGPVARQFELQVSTELVAELSRYSSRDRVRVLRPAIDTVGDRLDQFATQVEGLHAGAPIPWHVLDPDPVTGQDSLVAIYLILQALSILEAEDRGGAEELRHAWDTMPPQWQSGVWADAHDAFCTAVPAVAGTWCQLGLPLGGNSGQGEFPALADVKGTLQVIRQALSALKPQFYLHEP